MSRRRGFSLIELLIVVGVIAILATMSLVVMKDILDQSREDATAMTVTKVSELLEERITAFDRAASRGLVSQHATQVEADAKAAFGLPFNSRTRLLRKRVSEIIARKLLFRENFPQRFAEMVDTRDVVGGSAGPNLIPDIMEAQLRDPVSGDLTFDLSLHKPETESAELLYFMLTQMPVFGVAPVAGDGFNSGEVKDTDGDGLPEFVDAWAQPLRFYRWPTRLIDVDQFDTDDTTTVVEGVIAPSEREFANLLIRALPQANGITRDPLLIDPDDTIGRLGFELQRLNTAPIDLSLLYNEAQFHTIDVFHTPLIISAGEDGVLGLAEPWYVDGDWNGDGAVDGDPPGLSSNRAGTYSEDPNGNNAHDGIYGNLGSPEDFDQDGVITLADLDAVLDSMTDNITNRNRRAGGSN